MPDEEHVLTATANPEAGRAPSKLLILVRKRLRQLAIAGAALTIVLAIAAGGFAVWWLNSLNGLPDIGDPFDVAEFRTFDLPDAANAFTYYGKATDALKPLPELPRARPGASRQVAWSQAHPQLREWVSANGPAIDLFQKGAAMNDAISRPPGAIATGRQGRYLSPLVIELMVLDAGKRQQRGDLGGAWECLRGVLRAAAHLRRHGSFHERFMANLHLDAQRAAMGRWLADPKTTTAQLRAALDEVVATKPMPEWDVFSVKCSYVEFMESLDRPTSVVNRGLEQRLAYRLGDMQVPPDVAVYFFAVERFVAREPERSKRAARLLFANWLAHAEELGARPGKPSVRVSFQLQGSSLSLPLYPVKTVASKAAAIPPEELAKWLLTTRDFMPIFWASIWPSVRQKEKSGYHGLVLSLAEELYRRERGVPPSSDEALVGTYLESLPDDGTADLDDGTTRTISGG
jgi:hypothetical protein